MLSYGFLLENNVFKQLQKKQVSSFSSQLFIFFFVGLYHKMKFWKKKWLGLTWTDSFWLDLIWFQNIHMEKQQLHTYIHHSPLLKRCLWSFLDKVSVYIQFLAKTHCQTLKRPTFSSFLNLLCLHGWWLASSLPIPGVLLHFTATYRSVELCETIGWIVSRHRHSWVCVHANKQNTDPLRKTLLYSTTSGHRRNRVPLMMMICPLGVKFESVPTRDNKCWYIHFTYHIYCFIHLFLYIKLW